MSSRLLVVLLVLGVGGFAAFLYLESRENPQHAESTTGERTQARAASSRRDAGMPHAEDRSPDEALAKLGDGLESASGSRRGLEAAHIPGGKSRAGGATPADSAAGLPPALKNVETAVSSRASARPGAPAVAPAVASGPGRESGLSDHDGRLGGRTVTTAIAGGAPGASEDAAQNTEPAAMSLLSGTVLQSGIGTAIVDASFHLYDDSPAQDGQPAAVIQAQPRIDEASGAFLIGQLPAGSYRVEVGAPGFRSRVFGPITLSAGQEFGGLAVELEPLPGRIFGVVESVEDGAPIAGALVFLDDDRQKSLTHSPGQKIPDAVETDEHGRFLLANVAPGEHIVGILARDFAFTPLRGLIVLPGEELTAPRAVLERGAALDGVLRRRADVPKSELSVEVRSRFEEVRTPKLDKQGRFAVENLAPGVYTVAARWKSEGTTRTRSQRVALNAGDHKRVTFDFSRAENTGVLAGTVRKAGMPVSVPLKLLTVENGAKREFSARSEAETGRFELLDLPPGPCTLLIKGSRFEAEVLADATVEVFVDLPTNEVSGEVWDAQLDQGLAQATVLFELITPLDPSVSAGVRKKLVTNAEGRFAARDLPGGQYRLTASKAGYSPEVREAFVVPAQGVVEGVRLFLSGGVTLTGLVRDREGQPVSEARLRVKDAGGAVLAQTVSDRAGRFRFERLSGQVLAVEATHRDFQPAIEEGLALVPGDAKEISLTLKAWARLRVMVTDDRGKALLGAKVTLSDPLGKTTQAKVEAEAQGAAANFPKLADDLYVVQAALRGYQGADTASVLLVEGETRELTLVLKRRK